MTNRKRSCPIGACPTRPSCSSLAMASLVRIHRHLSPQPPIDTVFLHKDLSAARHADMLFVRVKDDGENDLAAFCVRENIQHVLFSDFARALVAVRSIVSGEKTAAEWFALGKV